MTKCSKYTKTEHDLAREMFEEDQRKGTLKAPPGIISGFANGMSFGLSERETRYEHYLPDARRRLRRSKR